MDKRCTLGTLAELAGAYEDDYERNPDEEGFSSSGADSPMDVDGESCSPGMSPYRSATSVESSPSFNKRQALRFGERGGAPIWALVNPSE